MGRFNSSLTRVEPVFKRLWESDPTGRTWLSPLLALGHQSSSYPVPALSELVANHPASWGSSERRLPAPIPLLRWLVENCRQPSGGLPPASPNTQTYRRKLLSRDPDTIRKALDRLKTSHRSGWHVLEGLSAPDAFLKSADFVVVVEGKRTERKATSTTTWLPLRSQMLRHMDAAGAAFPHHRVLGLMIVEDTAEDGFSPAEKWLNASRNTVSSATLDSSLPHLTALERRRLADGFLGVTTWKQVCRQFHIPWPPDRP